VVRYVIDLLNVHGMPSADRVERSTPLACCLLRCQLAVSHIKGFSDPRYELCLVTDRLRSKPIERPPFCYSAHECQFGMTPRRRCLRATAEADSTRPDPSLSASSVMWLVG